MSSAFSNFSIHKPQNFSGVPFVPYEAELVAMINAIWLCTYYGKRWRVENNIAENVDFFNLNSVQSPVIVQVNFDIAMTLIANSLYKILARKLRWFEQAAPKTISRKFINIESQINITAHEFIIQYKKNTYNPMIKDWINKLDEIKTPWIGNRKLVYEFL